MTVFTRPDTGFPAETLVILHALAKAHALAVPAMRRAAKKPVKIGFSSTGNLCYPCSENEADICPQEL